MKKKYAFLVLTLTFILFLLNQKIHMHNADEHRKANNGWLWCS